MTFGDAPRRFCHGPHLVVTAKGCLPALFRRNSRSASASRQTWHAD